MDPNVKQVVLVNLVIIPLDEINIVSIIFPYVPMISTGASSFFPPPCERPQGVPTPSAPWSGQWAASAANCGRPRRRLDGLFPWENPNLIAGWLIRSYPHDLGNIYNILLKYVMILIYCEWIWMDHIAEVYVMRKTIQTCWLKLLQFNLGICRRTWPPMEWTPDPRIEAFNHTTAMG
jgi:hypothetical protein